MGFVRTRANTHTAPENIKEWEERVHKTGATFDYVAELERILKRVIIVWDIAGEEYLWMSMNKLKLNPDKTDFLLVGTE